MPIQNIKGMLMDFAPQHAEAIAVFMRTGFNSRHDVWLEIPNKKENLISLDSLSELPEKPWLLTHDTVFEIKDAVYEKLKYLYIFSNPTDQKAYLGFDTIKDCITRSLDRLNSYHINSIAYILIPATENPDRVNTKEDDDKSATLMNESIQNWMLNNRELEVYLVDRVGGFKE
ncbi:hypothetical protein [Flavobacterium aciduliphilum]|uniref:Uncharacterized protein n=1 Tax=Flavobacterium aciduliphilum TaxID=1101402 RepID=A0A328YKG6_9FLAO|nr:hypothetical protein [Flavobacterium aciduliphilum]RAR73804.1 hypothetical protein CLV55_103123 [Flavobacterium aciduliphilum]